jgi:uncharacterized damage-inducible protein DinB
VLDRLLTYARGERLSQEQLKALAGEGKPREASSLPPASFPPRGAIGIELDRFNIQIDNALQQLTQTPEQTLTMPRVVGRAGIPSTVIGLLFHAAEHTMRHTGQLLVTARILGCHPDSGNRSEQ